MKFETYENYDPAQAVLMSEWNSVAQVLRNGELHEREFVLKKKAALQVSPLIRRLPYRSAPSLEGCLTGQPPHSGSSCLPRTLSLPLWINFVV
jgi:hypothetical protein